MVYLSSINKGVEKMPKVVKRNGQKVDFDKEKIKISIEKAMN